MTKSLLLGLLLSLFRKSNGQRNSDKFGTLHNLLQELSRQNGYSLMGTLFLFPEFSLISCTAVYNLIVSDYIIVSSQGLTADSALTDRKDAM